MGKLAEAYVEVTANLKPLEGSLRNAKGMLLGFAKSAAGALSGLALGGVGAGGIAGGLFLAAKKAADFGETISKVQVTFGKSSDAMIRQADDLAKRFGVVKQESLDAASAFGLMGRAANMSREQSGKLGQEMVQLGLDLASYHNISNQEAFEKLRAGLAGEAEPLRPLGIMLSEDAIKAEALATGLVKVKRELTDQEKIILRLSVIRRQAGDAVGDLARTGGSTANQLRKIEGELTNAATDFGKHLIGALESSIKLAHELGDAIKGATGKSAQENVGTWTQTAVDAARLMVATGGNAIGLGAMRLAGLGSGNLQEEADKLAGIDRNQRQGGAPGGATPRDKQIAALNQRNAERQVGAQNWLDFVNRQRSDEMVGSLKGLGRAILTDPIGSLGAIAGAFHPAGAGLAKGAAGAFRGAAKAAQAHIAKGPFQSETFGGGAEFASSSIQKALSEDDTSMKQLEAAKEAVAKLGDIKVNGEALLALLPRLSFGALLK